MLQPMHFPHLTTAPSQREGFTLIELLVVVAIIGVLAGIVLPIYGKVQDTARKTQVISDSRNMKVAILSYFGDYQKYPLNDKQSAAAQPQNGPGDGTGYDTLYGDIGGKYSSADLFDILRAIDIGPGHYNANDYLNSTKTVYWVGQAAKSLTNPRNGISQQTVNGVSVGGVTKPVPAGSFMDPWGHPYIIWIDAYKDGDMSIIANSIYYNANYKAGDIHTGLAPNGIEFTSMGPDGVVGSKTGSFPNGNGILANSDDIVTWH